MIKNNKIIVNFVIDNNQILSKQSGVYVITHNLTCKQYIGSTFNFLKRLNEHCLDKSKQEHISEY